MFGGNPGRSCLPKLRLDDFWQLQLSKPSNEQILKKCKLIIRTHKFEELAASNSFEALEYLQTKVFEIIDHNDEEQTKEVIKSFKIYILVRQFSDKMLLLIFIVSTIDLNAILSPKNTFN